MPFTHVEIEERKTRTIAWLFFVLMAIYVLSIIVLVWGIRFWLGFSGSLEGSHFIGALGVALLLALFHWAGSTHRLVDRVLATVLAQPADIEDTYHKRFRNIVEEVAIATGGRYRIEPHVISTTALNACAVADFNGRAAIAVTEGLLARLNRAQLEAVVGHEAAHIASGDSLGSSIFCGLFALHEEGLKRLSGLFSERHWRLRGRGAGLVLFVIVVLWVTNKVKRFCELFLSRQREYRADAVAVRLTRNPLGLAEALHVISNHWRGVGEQGESLSTIFIMDTGAEPLSEQTGLTSDLFSTHPPALQRIAALLGMAHIAPEQFSKEMDAKQRIQKPKQLLDETSQPAIQPIEDARRWFLWNRESWLGPFGLEQLRSRKDWLPENWVRQEGKDDAIPAHQDPHLLQLLRSRYGADASAEATTARECPNCRVSLSRRFYEGVPLDQCPACGGCYIKTDQIKRVLLREEYAFPEEVKRLAAAMPMVRQAKQIARRYGTLPYNQLKNRQCPSCKSAVVRKFYTEEYLVEVEQCWMCGLAWLDRLELELLQYLYEQRAAERKEAPNL
ncbi:MAG: M48 family metalloprotease [Candidatus Omnitrophica bacterium]|nr:M48 family metalloprotease [Candidatus Omnitrophota bacterium]